MCKTPGRWLAHPIRPGDEMTTERHEAQRHRGFRGHSQSCHIHSQSECAGTSHVICHRGWAAFAHVNCTAAARGMYQQTYISMQHSLQTYAVPEAGHNHTCGVSVATVQSLQYVAQEGAAQAACWAYSNKAHAQHCAMWHGPPRAELISLRSAKRRMQGRRHQPVCSCRPCAAGCRPHALHGSLVCRCSGGLHGLQWGCSTGRQRIAAVRVPSLQAAACKEGYQLLDGGSMRVGLRAGEAAGCMY